MTVPVKGGKPLIFKSAKELQNKIDAYFKECEEKELLTTLTSLAVYLDVDRRTLLNYKDRSDEYYRTINTAKSKIEANTERLGLQGKTNPALTIFSLKNNYGWVDKIETDITSGGEKISFTNVVPRPVDE